MTPSRRLELPPVERSEWSGEPDRTEGPFRSMPETGEALYAIGRRYRQELGVDGRWTMVVYPMTPDDALHPWESDELSATPFHHRTLVALENTLKRSHRHDDRSVEVFSDLDVDLGLPDVEPIRPDLIVMRGVTDPENLREHNGLFRMGRETADLRVPLVLEVTSKHTRQNDLLPEKKLGYSERVGCIEQYIVIDAGRAGDGHPIDLLDDHREAGRLVLRDPDEAGRIQVECLDALLELASEGDRTTVRLLDATTGEVLSGLFELDEQLTEERNRAAFEAARAEAERARADALEREVLELHRQLEARRSGQAGD